MNTSSQSFTTATGYESDFSQGSTAETEYLSDSDEFLSQESTPEEIRLQLEKMDKERKELQEKLKKKVLQEKSKRQRYREHFKDLAQDPKYKYFSKCLEKYGIIDVGVLTKSISLFYNLAQGGKLGASLNSCLMAQNEGYLSIVVLMAQLTHENQFRTRVADYNNKKTNEMAQLVGIDKLYKLNCVSFPFDLVKNCKTIYRDGSKKFYEVNFEELERLARRKPVVNQFMSIIRGKASGTVFTIATVERLSLLEKIVNHYEVENTRLLIDEADSLFSVTEEQDRKFTLPLSKLYQRAKIVELYTATPMRICLDSLRSYGAEVDFEVVLLPRSENHVSTVDYEFNTEIFRDRNRLNNSSQSISVDLPELEGFINEFIKTPTYIYDYKEESGALVVETKRNVCLINVSSQKKHHDEVFRLICGIKNERFTFVDWDGDGLKVYFSYVKHHEKNVLDLDLKINGHRFEKISKGYYFLPKATEKGVKIEDIWFFINSDSPYHDLHGNLIIDTGKYADRGINFVSKDFKSHLTHQVFLPSKAGDTANIIQAMNRLNGIFEDKGFYTPKVYTNEYGKTAALYGTEKIEYLMKQCERPDLTAEQINDIVNGVAQREKINFPMLSLPKILETKVPEYTIGAKKKKIPKEQYCNDGKSEVNIKFAPESEEVHTNHMALYVDSDDKNKFENQDDCYKKLYDSYSPEFKELLKEKRRIRRKTKRKITTIVEEEVEEEEERDPKVEVPKDLKEIYHLNGIYSEQQQRGINMIQDLISQQMLNKNIIYSRTKILTDKIKSEYDFTYHSLAGHLSHLCKNPQTPGKYFKAGITFYNQGNKWYFVVV